jgi:site-specific recombinase XerD
LRYHYQVVRPDGLPDIPLTLFINEQENWLADSSIALFAREILLFFTWASADRTALDNGWSPLGSPEAVRSLIRQYLSVEAKCRLTRRPDRNGLKVTFVRENGGGAVDVRILLAALKRFYETLIALRTYRDANPLVHEDAARLAAEVRRHYWQTVKELEGRPPMPAVSGVDPPSGFRLSANYFRLLRNEWIPKTIDDPDFPNAVYRAGQQHGWGLRELCIVRTLFEAGPRISEVLSLTALDWADSNFTNRFTATNKGSRGVRMKQLMVSMATAKLYRRYFDHETEGRRAHDRAGLTLTALAKMLAVEPERLATIPLFLTARGTPMTAKLFRDYHWSQALRSAGIDADPPLTRHWFVTNALRHIEKEAKDEAELKRKKQELIEYMKWRTGERTLQVYEHLQREERFPEKLA